MLSEGVHSLVDTGNQALLLYGQYRADLPPLSSEPKCNTPADLIIGTVDQDLRECCHAMLFAFVG